MIEGNYVITPGMGSYGASGSVSNYIQSGQAFFIQAASGRAALLLKKMPKPVAAARFLQQRDYLNHNCVPVCME